MPYYLGNVHGAFSASSCMAFKHGRTEPPIDSSDPKYNDMPPDERGRTWNHAAWFEDMVARTSVRLIKKRKDLRNCEIMFPNGFSFSEKIRDVIEDMEPRVHRYFRINLRDRDGTPWLQPYWFFPDVLVPRIEVIDEVATKESWRKFYNYEMNDVFGPVVAADRGRKNTAITYLFERQMGNHHFFNDVRMFNAGHCFFSDELGAALKRAGAASGIQLLRVEMTHTTSQGNG